MKNKSLAIRTALIIAITLIGIYFVFGPRRTPTGQDFTWQGIKTNLEENINLGLDLKGGSHLVMRVRTDEYLKTLTENNAQAALTAAQDAKLPVSGNSTVTQGSTYSFTLQLTDEAQAAAVAEEVKKKVDLFNWTEDASGNSITWSLPSNVQTVMKNQAVEQALKIIESRINAFGVKEPTLQRHGAESSAQILLQMPGVDDPERVKSLIGAESNLMLMKIVSPPSPSPVQTFPSEEAARQSLGGAVPPTRRIMPYAERDETAATQSPAERPKSFVIVEYPAVVDGSELRDANAVSRTGNDGDYQISFSFKPAGAQKFGEWTGRNINNYMAVVLNDEVKSAAYIRSQIFDQGEISGRFTKATADDLALTLRSGALPAKIEYLEERTVGPSLGADSIRSGVTASLAGLAFIVVFMLFYYRASGINSVIALSLNMILTVAGVVILDSTLTLPGIAGFILGIGMAVDSNVLIFERMREEIRAGQPVAKAVSTGFDRAFVTIIDANVTTIISATILYLYGSGPIRGFAVTLILALLINLFTSVFVSRTIFMWLLERNPEMKQISI
ncbi:MAG TPA: protein translocase subunit SecD [Pyrinomonadaceae bacterium]|nr:protein translocase subunit SecD [Chloracidobacterium sp.]HRJ89652.1 protein translocase subunit SecD [Pyrinomonadaceae bacterium]HRK52105.1 protein translocase subunit SecD [Pyrinomonadaceae bacterium]